MTAQGTGRVLLIIIGLAGIGIGAGELIATLSSRADWLTFAAWFLGPPVASDAVLMPAVAVIGYLTSLLPGRVRAWVVCSGIISAALIAVAAPFLGRPGLRLDNPTLLDRNYPVGLAIALAVVWVLVGGWQVAAHLLDRRR